MAQLLGSIRSKLRGKLFATSGHNHYGGVRHSRLIVTFGVVVAGLQFVTFMLGPVFVVVIAFSLIGAWIGILPSVTIVNGWIAIVASLLYVVLRVLGKYLDRKLDEMEGKPESSQADE